jgi:hypothetical protein
VTQRAVAPLQYLLGQTDENANSPEDLPAQNRNGDSCNEVVPAGTLGNLVCCTAGEKNSIHFRMKLDPICKQNVHGKEKLNPNPLPSLYLLQLIVICARGFKQSCIRMKHESLWIICPGRPVGLAVPTLVCRVQLCRFNFDCQVRGSRPPWTLEMLLCTPLSKEHLAND